MTVLAALLTAFLAGSIPFGFVLVRTLGKGDIRSVGSGNIGATNVGRLLGPIGWGATLLADAGKGVAGVWLAGWIAGGSEIGMALGAIGAVLGHCFTPWLGGRGGKGVATMLGAFGYLAPVPTVCAIVGFGVAFALSRTVSVGSLVAATVLPVAVLVLGGPVPHAAAATGATVVVVLRHRENVARLLAGRESRVGASKE